MMGIGNDDWTCDHGTGHLRRSRGFISAAEIPSGRVHSGFASLERIMGIGSGIITLRSKDERWLSRLSYEVIARNTRSDSRILYLQWVEYHERHWNLDHDELVRIAKGAGTDIHALEENLIIARSFCKDSNDEGSYWERLMMLQDVHLVILDSVSELYPSRPEGRGRRGAGRGAREAGFQAKRPEHETQDPEHRTMDHRPDAGSWNKDAGTRDTGRGTLTGAIGRFVQLCMRLGCVGVVLDRKTHREVHPYLAHVSSVIIDFERQGSDIRAETLKHTSMGDASEYIPRRGQYTLWKWL